jgi:hypothetical protein
MMLCHAVAFLLSMPLAADGASSAVTENVGKGQIDWTKRTVSATGNGAPSLNAANAAAARLEAERAAKLDAFRNLLEAVRGVRVSGKTSAGAAMDATPELSAKVRGLVQGFTVADIKYYSDGGVACTIEGPLDGVLAEALVPASGAAPATTGGEESATGLVVIATGLNVVPALAPRLVDEDGNVLYSPSHVGREALRTMVTVGYARSAADALKSPRAGNKPLTVKALRLVDSGGPDLVLNASDAALVRALGRVLSNARVTIVTN